MSKDSYGQNSDADKKKGPPKPPAEAAGGGDGAKGATGKPADGKSGTASLQDTYSKGAAARRAYAGVGGYVGSRPNASKEDDETGEKDGSADGEGTSPAEPAAPVAQQADSFQRGGLPHAGRTATPVERTRDEMVVILTLMIARMQPLIAGLEPRMEIMRHAFAAAEQKVPGVENQEFKHELSEKSQKIAAYLAKMLKAKPAIARQMAIALFRYYESTGLLEKARLAIACEDVTEDIPASHYEGLNLNFFYLGNYHQEFKDETVLSQLFPAPKAGGSEGGTGDEEADEDARYVLNMQKQDLIDRGERLASYLAPRMDLILPTIDQLEKGTGTSSHLAGVFMNMGQTNVRLLCLQLTGDTAAPEQLKKAKVLYERLQYELKMASLGDAATPIATTITDFAALIDEWSKHPILKDQLNPKLVPPV